MISTPVPTTTLDHASRQVLFLLEADGTIVAMTPSARAYARALLGHPVQAGDSLLDVDTGDAAADFAERLAAAAAGQRSRVRRLVHYGNGTERAWEASYDPVPVPEGHPPRVLFGAVDVTEQAALEERLALFERVFESLDEGVLIADARREDDPILYANPAAERITGHDRDHLLGRNARFLHRDDRDQPGLDELRAAKAAGRSTRVELRNWRRDGQPFWNEVSLVPVKADDGTLTHWLGIQRDVTAIREQRRRMERAESQLAAHDRVASVVHNLNNLLTLLELGVEGLRGEPDPAEQARLLDELRSTLRSGSAITRRALGRPTGGPRSTDLTAFLREREPLYRRWLGSVAELVVEAPNEPLVIDLPPSGVEQVLGNLIDNAREELRLAGGGTVHIGLGREAGRAVLTVTDDGRGVPAELLHRVFEPRVSSREEHEGSGLGLTSVRRLVERGGGTVAVDSRPGRTVFTVRLPARRRTSLPSRRHGLGTTHVLFVEDESLLRRMVTRHLARGPYQITEAATARAAREVGRDQHHDVLLLDLDLPDGDGEQVAHELRALDPQLEVIVTTGHSVLDLPDDWQVLLKPYGLADLDLALRRAMARRAAAKPG